MQTEKAIELAIGPMSSEIIEAVFRYSHNRQHPLMLIASKNQIDHNGGYVNGWTTQEYMNFVRALRSQYPAAQVTICRDHCGPGFNGRHDMSDVYATIESDIAHGFDLIHIDFCHFQGTKEERLAAARDAVLHCLKLNPSIQLEIGTDENNGTNYDATILGELEQDIDFFKSFCNPKYYVVQTGSLIKEINQVGEFNKLFVNEAAKLFSKKGIGLKEHNADYLPKDEIKMRRGIVDAQNIAPQLGVIQTNLILTKCLIYGIPLGSFVDAVHQGGKWKKWLHTHTADNKMLCAMIAGHYHFASPEYQNLVHELEKRENIKETIMSHIEDTIHHYVSE